MASPEESRRMALRRDSGNRKPSQPKAPKLGVQYLIAHACFTCRKSFKLAPREGAAPCGVCGSQLCEMGRSFKAPKASDTKQWQKVQTLYAAGFRFSSYRSHPCAPLPSKLSEVEAFIREHPQHPMRVAAPNQAFKPTDEDMLDSSTNLPRSSGLTRR